LTKMRTADLILDAIDRLDPKELAGRRSAIQSAEAARMLEAISLATM
jgi:hypothetical protein